MFLGWTADDYSAFYVVTNERDARFFDLYRYDAKTYARTLLYKNDGGYQSRDVSRDEKWIALDKPRTTTDSDIYPLERGERRSTKHITAAQGRRVSYRPPSSTRAPPPSTSSPTGAREFTRVARYVLATDKVEDVERANWDIVYTYFSKQRRLPRHGHQRGRPHRHPALRT